MAEKKTNSGLLAMAKTMVGQGYWTGCYGQKATQELYDYKRQQYPTATFPNNYKEQIEQGTRVMDCSGMVKGYAWGLSLDTDPVYDAATDWNQQGMYTRATVKGPISTFPKKDGALVFLGSSATSLTHVGVYSAEDDCVYHASSPANGVKVSTFKEFGASYWCQYSEIEDDTGLTDGFDPEAGQEYTEKLDVDGYWGELTVRRLQTVLGTTIDGTVSNQYTSERDRNPGLAQVEGIWQFVDSPAGYSEMIKGLQSLLNESNGAGLTVDGYIGEKTIKAMQHFFGTTEDGVISKPSDVVKALQSWLNNQLEVDGWWGKKTTTRLQEVLSTATVDGIISDQWEQYKDDNPGCQSETFEWKAEPKDYSRVMLALQQMIGLTWDEGGNGWIGPVTIKALQKFFGTEQDGTISGPSEVVKAMQKWLNKQA